ncbi:MAG: hypothetical protein SGPRY_005740 [Prymnesium sp.]
MPTPIEGVDGNWRCHSCNNINLGVRERCNRCALPKAFDVHSAMTAALPLPKKGPVEGVDGNWRCSSCSNINFGIREKCNRCAAPRAAVAAQHYVDGSGHVYHLGLDGQLGLKSGSNGKCSSPLQILSQQQGSHGSNSASASSSATNVAHLEAQVALLYQRQTNLELQVQALQGQLSQQAALLSSAGLNPSLLRQRQ